MTPDSTILVPINESPIGDDSKMVITTDSTISDVNDDNNDDNCGSNDLSSNDDVSHQNRSNLNNIVQYNIIAGPRQESPLKAPSILTNQSKAAASEIYRSGWKSSATNRLSLNNERIRVLLSKCRTLRISRRNDSYSILYRMLIQRIILGGLIGAALFVLCFLALNSISPFSLPTLLRSNCVNCRGFGNIRSMTSPESGISSYLSLFGGGIQQNKSQHVNNNHQRQLASESQTKTRDPLLVIAGKMNVLDGACSIAQMNLKTNEWDSSGRVRLTLDNSYSGGEVYSLLANHTTRQQETSDDTSTKNSKQYYEGSGELIVVGAFDRTVGISQTLYCSVGRWDGAQLNKVGEGLCSTPLSKGMKITTAAMAGPQDVYVAGSFQTKVWIGERHQNVEILNLAHFNAAEQLWLPLNVGQITCSWCTVTVLALAWDSKRQQLHVAGKFNAIYDRNVPAGLAVFNRQTGFLVAHPGGGLSMRNSTQDGVGTALQLDEDSGVLYVMGSFERLTATHEVCLGLAAYEINANRWTCLADAAHTVLPTGGGNMLLTPHGLMVAGRTTSSTTWPDSTKPYTIALLKATLKKQSSDTSTSTKQHSRKSGSDNKNAPVLENEEYHDFTWSWLPGFDGHDKPIHALSNGFGEHEGTVFIAGDDLVAKWSYQPSYDSGTETKSGYVNRRDLASTSPQPQFVPVTEVLTQGLVRGAIMAISQLLPEQEENKQNESSINPTIIVYCVAVGCVIGMFGAILCNRNLSSTVFPFFRGDSHLKGISLDTLTYSAIDRTNITDLHRRAMQTRYVQHPHLLTIIDPQELFLQRIIGEGTFGRVWSARWRSASVAVKEFVFAQAAVAGRSAMQQEIVEEIVGEAGMMAILRHPNVLQLFGCSLTAQAIWIVSELCSLGSLRQLLDDKRVLPVTERANLALQVAEGMTYLHNQDPPIIHRDLKSHNIFVHETFTDLEDGNDNTRHSQNSSSKLSTKSTMVAKIGDWGSARATLSGSRTMTHGVGTACWLAPEVIKHARSSKYSDVYGYGIVLWELATREEVYQGLETTQIIAKVANESLRPPVPQDCPWKDLMVKCWEENPHDRLEFDDIVSKLNVVLSGIDTSDSIDGDDDENDN